MGAAQELGEPVANGEPPHSHSLYDHLPPINHTCAVFQLTMVEGGGLTQCFECEKNKKRAIMFTHQKKQGQQHREHLPGPLTLL